MEQIEITLPYTDLAYWSQATYHQKPREAWVTEEELPSGRILYKLQYQPKSIPVGKTTYWTNTSGATYRYHYLGKRLVTVQGSPDFEED